MNGKCPLLSAGLKDLSWTNVGRPEDTRKPDTIITPSVLFELHTDKRDWCGEPDNSRTLITARVGIRFQFLRNITPDWTQSFPVEFAPS
jgi:hypothetical protein